MIPKNIDADGLSTEFAASGVKLVDSKVEIEIGSDQNSPANSPIVKHNLSSF